MEPKNEEERDRGAEHPDLVLKGEEEHPLLPPLPVADVDEPADW
jgi:hypothetical protein